jgi:hypothetical protein
MKENAPEEMLKSRFAAMRRQDERSTPDFDSMTRITVRARSPFANPWFGMAAAAAILLLVAGPSLFVNRPLAADEDWQSWTALSDWQAKTDTLLDVPETGWKSSLSSAEISASEAEVD